MATRALYCPALCDHLVRYDDSTFWWMRAQQRRQAECYWRIWCQRKPRLIPVLMEHEDVSFYDLWVAEFPNDPVLPPRPHQVTRVLSDGMKWVQRLRMIDALADVVGNACQRQTAQLMRAEGDPVEMKKLNTRASWVESWRTCLELIDGELKRSQKSEGGEHAET